MISSTRIGIYLAACSFLCGIIAVERYQLKVRTARALAEAMGIEIVSISIPIESTVAGFFAVVLAVAGISCILRKN